jgi:DNA-binding response OmpR family regulator
MTKGKQKSMWILENKTLLYIENDLQCRQKYSKIMRDNGMHVIETDEISGARDILKKTEINLILLDLNLHQEDRMAFMKFLRDNDVVVPIIITARHSDKEILLEAINLDTSYYLIKPFESSELLLALEAACKKILNNSQFIIIDLENGYRYDSINKSVDRPDGSTVYLTKKESSLLELLLRNNRIFIPYETIGEHVWKEKTMSIDTLRTLVRALRHKTYSNLIANHSSLGYRINL